MHYDLTVPQIHHLILNIKNEKWQTMLALFALLILSLGFLYTLINDSYELIQLIGESKKQSQQISQMHGFNAPQAASAQNQASNQIHLFGEDATPANLAKSNYKLMGIEYSAHQAKAYISTDNAEPALYKVGDRMPSGALIQRIEAKEVILFHHGEREKLHLNWEIGS